MQFDQVQKLTQLIKTSSVLHDDERQSWLAMLPVMNDKQASDLFQILTSSVVKKQPSLHHIANLPTEMSYHMNSGTQSRAKPVAVKRVPPQTAPHPDMGQVIKRRLEEKELPPSHIPEPLELSAPPSPRPKQPVPVQNAGEDREVATMRHKMIDGNAVQPARAQAIGSQSHTNEYIPLDELLAAREQRKKQREDINAVVPAYTEPTSESEVIEAISKIEDVAQCTLGMLRNQGFETLNQPLVGLARKYGYFAVALRFEQSPLYQQYLVTGQSWLAGNSNTGTSVFSKEEFEKVTDLLRNIRIS